MSHVNTNQPVVEGIAIQIDSGREVHELANTHNNNVADESFDCWLKRHTNFFKKYFAPYIVLVIICALWADEDPQVGAIVAVILPALYIIIALFWGAFKYNKQAKPHTFVPIKWMWLFFIIGCITIPVAMFLTLILSTLNPLLLINGVSPFVKEFISSAIIAPICEESCKFFTIFWVVLKKVDSSQIARNPASVIVYGVIGAQTFAMIEDFMYIYFDEHDETELEEEEKQEESTPIALLIVIRILFPLHSLFGMIHATKLAYLTKFNEYWIRSEGTLKENRKSSCCQIFSQIGKVMWLPVLLHVTWNGTFVLMEDVSTWFGLILIPYAVIAFYYPLRLYHQYFAQWGKHAGAVHHTTMLNHTNINIMNLNPNIV